jgi:hypothetical protein
MGPEMKIFLPLLLAIGAAASAAEPPTTPPAQPSVESKAEATPEIPQNDLMPAFVTYCMEPQDVDAYFADRGVIAIPDRRPDVPELERMKAYRIMAGDMQVTVVTKPTACGVMKDGVHDAATLASFEKFLHSAGNVFDVVQEAVPPATKSERIVSVYQLVDKQKKFRWRFTLSVNSRDGKSPATIVSRDVGAY